MDHSDFSIGLLFRTGSGLWRCTDIGTRTIIAIHLDEVEVESSDGGHWTLDREEAERQGWFHGPPYAVVEHVFDEDDIGGCDPDEPELTPEGQAPANDGE